MDVRDTEWTCKALEGIVQVLNEHLKGGGNQNADAIIEQNCIKFNVDRYRLNQLILVQKSISPNSVIKERYMRSELEDNLNFWKLKTTSLFLKIEANLIILYQMEDDLKILVNGRLALKIT